MSKFRLFSVLLAVFVTGVYTVAVNADHAWKKYHWDISVIPIDEASLELGDNLTGDWSDILKNASPSWNMWSVLKSTIVLGRSDTGVNNDKCGPVLEGVEVCNGLYGANGWLGLASVWVSRGKHIVQAVVKLNDTYFEDDEYYKKSPYNSVDWRDYVMCQEVGHTFGLGHQDEVFDNLNLNTCMDYTDEPAGGTYFNIDGVEILSLPNLYPNEHDAEILLEIYAHLNPTDAGNSTDDGDDGGGGGNGKGGGRKNNKAGDAGAIDLNDPSQWGQAIRQDARGQNILFERNLANGQVLITHVLWAN